MSNGIQPQQTSLEIFKSFVTSDGKGNTDASGVLSKACYKVWLSSRKNCLKNPELTFVQSVRGHIIGTKEVGRHPFSAPVEQSLLKLIRRKKVWPCFEGTKVKYGSRGMQITGFHEGSRENGIHEQPEAKYIGYEIGGLEAPLLYTGGMHFELQPIMDLEFTDSSRKRASSNTLDYTSTKKRQIICDSTLDRMTVNSLLQRRGSSCLLDSLDLQLPSHFEVAL